jgi:sodium/pantothenate symporter
MRYFHLVAERPLVWALFFLFTLSTAWLAWKGHKKTTDIRSFAIGRGDIGPFVIGVTLASSIASTATFVINPGFVYVHGISALMHLGVAAGLGLVVGLFALSNGFRRVGAKTRAITLPHWMSTRFGDERLGVLFALVNLLSLTFVVLIVGGISIVMQQTLGLTNTESLLFTIVFVFGYVFVGGTYAHAYTNTLQGVIMAIVAALIVGSGFHLLTGGHALASIAQQDPNLTKLVNPASPLFGSYFSVYVSGFVIGFALVCQPHILGKALYVKTEREVRRYLLIAVAVSLVFTGLLLVGLYARLLQIPASAFVNPVTGAFSQDRVMAVYLARSFDPVTLSFVTVAVLAAGMSTLDGILIALSSIAANDLVMGIAGRRWLSDASEERRATIAHRVSQGLLVVMGAGAFLVALHPPKLLGIFGQIGVYGIVAASAVPILGGIAFEHLRARTAWVSALTGLGVHFTLYALGAAGFARGHELGNPGVTATWAILASAAVAVPGVLRARAERRRSLPPPAFAPADG